MADPLKSLLDMWREAERAARIKLEEAVAARTKADEEETRLRQALRVAKVAWTLENRSPRAAPKNAAEAQARERYRERLAGEARRAAQELEAHAAGARADAVHAEEAARAAYEEASKQLEAALKLEERADAEAAKRAERRAEDAAADHANAAHVRRREEP